MTDPVLYAGARRSGAQPTVRKTQNRASGIVPADGRATGQAGLRRTRKRSDRQTPEPYQARKRTILTSIPGIGRRIAAVLITGLPELGCLDRKAAASLAGMGPHPTQSGSHPGRHAIVGGRPCLRSAFYMAGTVAARSCPTFKIPYRAMREAGKPAKVATGRRLVVLANALLKDNKTFADSKLMA